MHKACSYESKVSLSERANNLLSVVMGAYGCYNDSGVI